MPEAEDVALDLETLCARYGIERGYDDFWGHRHAASSETLHALLHASGALGTFGEPPAPQTAIVPAALVVQANLAPVAITLRMAAHAEASTLVWRIALEDGGSRCGELQVEASHTATTLLLALQEALPEGYHTLTLRGVPQDGGALVSTLLIAHGGRCYQPPAFAHGAKLWGPAIQLYALPSTRNWGIGDFSDLQTLVDFAAGYGAGVIGLNPLHALFADRPAQASPYSPSSRLALHALYLDVERIPEFATCAAAREHVAQPAFQARLQQLRAASLVDYEGVAAAKSGVLGLLYREFRQQLAQDSERALAFRAFQREQSRGLRRHALFEALQEYFRAQDDEVWGWPRWPLAYHHPDSDAVEQFARAQVERVEYFEYLQWNADLQLAAAHARALACGMPLGLYRDLAVGVNPGGSDAWIAGDLFAPGVRVGAPPDEFNPTGQNWGLPPFVPQRLQAAGYAPFIDMLRANLRHAGALRIDHVMGLLRLFWIPEGAPSSAGTYVKYALDDLMGILALESMRHRCVIVGEDLGTVPDEIRTAMQTFGVLSYRPLYFSRTHNGEFAPPADYPQQALVAVSTHDLPTLAGYWSGADLEVRTRLALFPTPELRTRQIDERVLDRARLWRLLHAMQLIPADDGASPPTLDATAVEAVHRLLAMTPAHLLMVQLEDVLGQSEQVNLPSTSEDQYPNWRRKLPLPLEEWAGQPPVHALLSALRALRGTLLDADRSDRYLP